VEIAGPSPALARADQRNSDIRRGRRRGSSTGAASGVFASLATKPKTALNDPTPCGRRNEP